MSAFLAFAGTYLLSLLVALLAALQLADYFGASEEFILVLMALPVFVLFCLAVFVVAGKVARSAQVFHWAAAFLALLALSPLALPALAQTFAGRTAGPFAAGIEITPVVIELIVPALLAVLVQWGLVRRRWLRLAGQDDLTRWPWVTTMIAGLVVLNPFGLDVLGQAIAYRPTDWLRDLARTMALCGAAMVIAMTLIEYYIRGRLQRRRAAS